MRVTRYFIAVVGIASLVFQYASPPAALGWGPFSSAGNGAGAQQANDDDIIVDQSVQQAAWQQPTQRPAPRATAANSAPRGTRPQVAATDRKGALFHGHEMKMPELPFARSNTGRRSAQDQPQSRTAASPGNRNMARGIPPAGARPVMPQQMSPSRFHASTGAAATRQVAPNRPISAGLQVQSRSAPNSPPRPTRSAMLMPQVTSHPTQSIKAPSPIVKTSTTAPQITQASNGQGEKLIAQAHQLSTSAQSDADYTRIIETCRRAKQIGSNQVVAEFADDLSSWALNRRGQLKAEAGRDSEAIRDFDEAIRANHRCWRALHNRGVLLAQAGQFEKAFDDFNHTIECNVEFAKAYSNRAALFMVADNLAGASEDYQRAIDLDANLQVAHRGYARVCHLIGRLEEAASHYNIAVQLAPNDAFAVACRADLLADMGCYAESAAGYERAIALEPKSAQALGGSAWLLATCPDNTVRKPALAVGRATQAIQVRANKDATDFDTLAAAQASAGNFPAAVQSMQMALKLAQAGEREIYQDRLAMYQQNKPYRISPMRQTVAQANFEERAVGK